MPLANDDQTSQFLCSHKNKATLGLNCPWMGDCLEILDVDALGALQMQLIGKREYQMR